MKKMKNVRGYPSKYPLLYEKDDFPNHVKNGEGVVTISATGEIRYWVMRNGEYVNETR